MEAKVDEIADGVYRISAYVPDIAPPAGFTFNHFLVLGDEPRRSRRSCRRRSSGGSALAITKRMSAAP
jgi:hypothetical protein